MKKINMFRFISFIIMGVLLVLIIGCKKSKDNSVTVTDIDGNIYHTLTIGTQVWMSENLKTTKYRNGDSIPTTTSDISGASTPKYQWAYDNNKSNVATYGRLYTWFTITDNRNVCPAGWHVPTDVEWETLKSFLGGESAAGGKLKETGTAHWQSPNTGATNQTGFAALPGGYRIFNGSFASLNISCSYWSSAENQINTAWGWGQALHFDSNILLRGGFNKPNGVSVRCISD